MRDSSNQAYYYFRQARVSDNGIIDDIDNAYTWKPLYRQFSLHH